MRALDTNIFLRYIMPTDMRKHGECDRLFDRLRNSQEEAMTTQVVIHEVCYVLSASGPNFYNLSHQDVRDRLYPLLELDSLHIKDKDVCLDALNTFAQREYIDYSDALLVAYVRNHEAQGVCSYDAKSLGKIPDANRSIP